METQMQKDLNKLTEIGVATLVVGAQCAAVVMGFLFIAQ